MTDTSNTFDGTENLAINLVRIWFTREQPAENLTYYDMIQLFESQHEPLTDPWSEIPAAVDWLEQNAYVNPGPSTYGGRPVDRIWQLAAKAQKLRGN